MGRLLTALEEDLGNSMLGLGMTLIYHYMNARKSIVAARELTREVQDNVADAAGMTVWVLRPKLTANKKKNRRKRKSWVKLKSSDLLPGDVFLIPSSSAPSLDASMNLTFIKNKHNNAVMPVDALLLDGTCICDEVVLTGESVPQCKVPLDPEDDTDLQNKDPDNTFDHVTRLDMLGSHRGSVLFAGTTLMHCTNKASRVTTDEETDSKWPKELLPGNGSDEAPIKFLALRTGSYSSRGELLRALSKSNNGVGSISNAETERDALRLIFTLSLFAVAACISLFVPVKALDGSPKRPPISVFRKIVQCTRIVISSIPSELPLALSSVAHACSLKLRNSADVVCSQPASLITVAHVDIVVFDKTGTLTADTQNLKYLVHYKDSSVSPKEERKSSHKKRKKLKANKATSPHDISHPMADTVLAGCHSLFPMLVEDNEGTVESQIQSEDQRIRLLGDPVDQCSFRFTGWIHDFVEGCYKDSATSSKKMSSKNNNNKPIKIWQLKVFPFDPKRRRSSALVLCLHEDGDFRLWKLVKGSPDAMSRLLIEENGGNHLNSTLREPFADWYKDTNIHLGSEGLRVISMGAGDLTRDGHIVDLVFPQGLPKSLKEMKSSIGALASLIDAQTLLSIDTARSLARDNVHRDVVESFKQSSGSERPLDFVGFACFEAGLRPSTHRIVREIKQAGRHSLMLTGDGVDAAMAVAKEAGILAGAATAVLELTTEGVKQYLSWRLIRGDSKKGGKRRKSREGRSKTLSFTTKTVERIRQQNEAGLCDVVATGAAIDFLLCHLSRRSGLVGNDKSRCHDALQNQLPGLAVVAGASPQTKQRVIDALRQGGKKKVLMCGKLTLSNIDIMSYIFR
jgi:magnesium-transporting ATPase (P-type)